MTEDTKVMTTGDMIADLRKRVEFLERLLQCPRCLGTGSVGHGLNQDECPECHGEKWRFMG